jgi:hypothetical protein
MKYFFAFTFLLLAGCRTSTEPANPYAPGGEYYVAPGTFTGTWLIGYYINSPNVAYTYQSTIIITECDSNLVGTITNDSTKEVLSLRGVHTTFSQSYTAPLHNYWITSDRGSFGDTATGGFFTFYWGGDSIEYSGQRDLPGWPGFSILCARKQ